MRFAFSQRLFLFAAAAFAALPLVVSAEIGVAFQGALIGGWCLGGFIGPPLTARPTYRRTVTVGLLMVTTVQIVRVFLGMPLAMGAMELIAALLAAKLVDRAHAADDYQIVVLSFMHLIAATVAMDTLVFGVCFLGFTACAVPALAMTHLRQEMESRFGRGSKQPDARKVLDRLFGSKRIITPGFLIGSSLLSLPVLLLTILLFIFFPRFGLGFLGRLPSTEQTVGFGDTVSLSDSDISNLEDTVLIRLEPSDPGATPEARLSLRLRAAVLDAFDGNTWARHRNPKWRAMKYTERGYVLDQADTGRGDEMDVMLEAMQPKLLALPEGTAWIQPEEAADRRGNMRPRLLVINEEGEIEYEDRQEAGIRYRVSITGAAPPGRPPSHSGETLALFPGAARLQQTARELAGDGTKRERAARLVRALKTGYRYSLTVADDPKNDLESTSLYRFLYARKTGNCEHFASVLTLMLRAVGIPARLITGFSGADWNPIGEFYAVRQRYAHAWTEAFIDGRWISLDAVPSASTSQTGAGMPGFFAMLLETMQMQWRKRVVGYDLDTQGKMTLGLWRYLRQGNGAAHAAGRWKRHLSAVALLTTLIALTLFVLRRFRRLLPSTRKDGSPGYRPPPLRREAAHLYSILERRLRRLGYPRPPHVTPVEHLTAIAPSVPFSLADAAHIMRRYNEVRFGASTFSKGELKSLLKTAEHLGRKRAEAESSTADAVGRSH